jgi:ABC-type protease/lipase transport system fused ATPase/permease subunit
MQMKANDVSGTMSASSRALAPVDMAIANWKNVVQARTAWARIIDTMVALADEHKPMNLPMASKTFKVEKLTVAAPSSGRACALRLVFRRCDG